MNCDRVWTGKACHTEPKSPVLAIAEQTRKPLTLVLKSGDCKITEIRLMSTCYTRVISCKRKVFELLSWWLDFTSNPWKLLPMIPCLGRLITFLAFAWSIDMSQWFLARSEASLVAVGRFCCHSLNLTVFSNQCLFFFLRELWKSLPISIQLITFLKL